MNQYFACKSLIQFDLLQSTPENVQDMIRDISNYQQLWNKKKSTVAPQTLEQTMKEFDLQFIQNINTQEGIGTQKTTDTREILQTISDNNINPSPPKTHTETLNLYKGLLYLRKLMSITIEDQGLLEVEMFIKDLHVILMTNVTINNTLTPPGVFSTRQRLTSYKGEIHYYPVNTQQEWELQITTLVDRYNALITFIKSSLDTQETATQDLYKTATWFFFNLLSLHPFSDGNGRLCRLLLCYILSLTTPFPIPINNITTNNDFINAIIQDRRGSGHPLFLTSLIIQSSWYAWNIFLQQVGIAPTCSNTL